MKRRLVHNIQSINKKVLSWFLPSYLKIKSHFYRPYDSAEFRDGLSAMGIDPGDSLLVICSANRIRLKSGSMPPVHTMLNDLLDHLGSEGTLMALAFSQPYQQIIDRSEVFDVRKTPTRGGILVELLRRKPGVIRSLDPLYSVIAWGKKAEEFCATHSLSSCPYDELSPYRKMAADRGKYLGIGIGFEGFSPAHMVEDYFKQNFLRQMYEDHPRSFQMIAADGNIINTVKYVRNFTGYSTFDPLYYFRLLGVTHKSMVTTSGLSLFVMNMQEFLDRAIELHESRKITIYDTGGIFRKNMVRARHIFRILGDVSA